MTVFESPVFHQFMVAGMIGFLLGQLSVSLVQVPRWLLGTLTE